MSRSRKSVSVCHTEEERLQAAAALALLHQAWDRAQALRVNPWQYALSIRQFWEAGVDNTALCELLVLRCIAHRTERPRHRRGESVFERAGHQRSVGGAASC